MSKGIGNSRPTTIVWWPSSRTRNPWEAGTRQDYHAIALGYYESELLRRVDPQHRSHVRFFQDEIATLLKLGFHIRLPESIPDSRLAVLTSPALLAVLRGFASTRRSNIIRALDGALFPHDE